MPKSIDISGQTFGRLTAIKLSAKRKGGRAWLCQCECGAKKTVLQHRLRSGHTKSCGCLIRVDLTGKKFGRLTAIEPTGKVNYGSRTWRCICECGIAKIAAARDLVAGHVKSCGCLMGPDDITGQRFGKLVAIEPTEMTDSHYVWRCRCDCGESPEVNISKLRSGHTKSCGCLKHEHPGMAPIHGATVGGERSQEYQAWSLMKNRCSNPKQKGYEYYGGAGKIVCARWQMSFPNFLEDMGPKPGVGHEVGLHLISGRIFGPGKCRWATHTEIIRGRSNTVFATIKGVRRPFAEWYERAKPTPVVRYSVAFTRYRRGWSVHDALTTPLLRQRDLYGFVDPRDEKP